MHAWCVDQQDRVVDPTWPHGVAYFGIVFRWDYMLWITLKKDTFGILSDLEAAQGLLTGEHPLSEAVIERCLTPCLEVPDNGCRA